MKGEVSTGGHDDLSKATDIAKSMFKEFGMSERVGHIAYEKERKSMFLDIGPDHQGKDYSEETAREIDNEIKRIVEGAYEAVTQILRYRQPLLEQVAKILLDKEVLDGEELRKLVREYAEKEVRKGEDSGAEYREEADRSYQ